MQHTPAIRMEGVGVLGDPEAPPLLDDVSWTVRPAEHWAVVGPNGAGKSTLLGVAAGVITPTRGSVEVFGRGFDAVGLSNPALQIGLIESRPRAYAQNLKVEEVVYMHRSGPAGVMGSRIPASERERARELLARLDCAHLASRPYRTCSQGERQRVLLARAMMRDPKLLLLDEPSSALDVIARETFVEAVTALVGEAPDLATVTVAHHLEELPPLVTNALVLRAGQILHAGPVEHVLEDSKLSQAFGSPVETQRVGGRWRLAPAARGL